MLVRTLPFSVYSVFHSKFFLFNRLRTLSQNTGGGYQLFPKWNSGTLFHESRITNHKSRITNNSFRVRSSKKHGGRGVVLVRLTKGFCLPTSLSALLPYCARFRPFPASILENYSGWFCSAPKIFGPKSTTSLTAFVSSRSMRETSALLSASTNASRIAGSIALRALGSSIPSRATVSIPSSDSAMRRAASSEAHSPSATSLMRSPSGRAAKVTHRSEEHTSELQSRPHLVCRLLLEKKKRTRLCH